MKKIIKSFGYLKKMLNFALANEKVERFSISGNKTFCAYNNI